MTETEVLMLYKAYIAIAIFGALGLRQLAISYLSAQVRLIQKVITCRKILIANTEKLDRWQKVRPFIYRGYCSYARRLIVEMIDAYEFLLTTKYENDTEVLASLKRLLDEFPPDYDPPVTGGSFVF